MVANTESKGISIMQSILDLNKQIKDLSSDLVQLEANSDHFGGISFKLTGVVDPVVLTYTYGDQFNVKAGEFNMNNIGYKQIIDFFVEYLNKKNKTEVLTKNPNCLLCTNWMTTEDEDHSVCEKCWTAMGSDDEVPPVTEVSSVS